MQRQEANGAHWLEASHDGWRKPFGALHRRRLYMAESGEDIRGEDAVEATDARSPSPCASTCIPTSTPACSRTARRCCCGCHPAVAGGCARTGARMALEESIYLGGPEPRRSEQVVLDRPHRRPAAGEMGDHQGRASRFPRRQTFSVEGKKASFLPLLARGRGPGWEGASRMKIVEVTNVDFSLRHFLLPLMRGARGARPRGGRRLRRRPAARRRCARRGSGSTPLPLARSLSPARAAAGVPRAAGGCCGAERPDLVHAHMPISGFLGRLAARRRRRAARRLYLPRLPVQPARALAAPRRLARRWSGSAGG